MASLQRIIWLASFPKSGNTWTRVLPRQLLHAARTGAGHQQPLPLHHGRRPPGLLRPGQRRLRSWRATSQHWLETRPKVLRAIAASKPGHHFVKTHCQVRRIAGHDLIVPEVTAAADLCHAQPLRPRALLCAPSRRERRQDDRPDGRPQGDQRRRDRHLRGDRPLGRPHRVLGRRARPAAPRHAL